jgi:hypothetical protein
VHDDLHAMKVDCGDNRLSEEDVVRMEEPLA